jgi:tetratricopeptide (TPR) repeat protein
MIFVPTGRAINPVTKTNWEGVGVKPDIAVKADVALDTALVLARAAAQTHRIASENAEQSARDALAQGIQSGITLLQTQPAEGERAIAAALQKGIAAGILDEGAINALGYEYLGQKKNDVAIAVFKFNVQTFPASSNVWDSLGEGYMNAGQRELAITNYRKSLELDPNNQNAVAMLQKLQKPQ